MDCRTFRGLLADTSQAALPPDARRHLEHCPECRAHLLLRLGSTVDAEAVPASGFEARLRACLEAPRGGSAEAPWTEAVGWAAPGVLCFAVTGLLIVGCFYFIVERSAAGDLGTLAEQDPVVAPSFEYASKGFKHLQSVAGSLFH